MRIRIRYGFLETTQIQKLVEVFGERLESLSVDNLRTLFYIVYSYTKKEFSTPNFIFDKEGFDWVIKDNQLECSKNVESALDVLGGLDGVHSKNLLIVLSQEKHYQMHGTYTGPTVEADPIFRLFNK